ncbi:RagB/SusD family nutrient uptake outer membrane protein [Sphingobacterium faecium]|uniref:RagB/SusD family nutrient uptake outer membrane protein n=1 Tax=Sphingobacterium faecium TaxID=34087 RepID=UPI0032078D98
MKFKKITYLLTASTLLLSMSSCEKFLNVTPIDALSGNNFWKTKKDVEGYTNGIYLKLKNKFGGTMLIPSLDMRGNYVKVVENLDSDGSGPVNSLISNNMTSVMNGSTTYHNRIKDNMNWKAWYDVIAASNILYYETGRLDAPGFSETDRRQYQAEAVFTRNLSYLFLCRMFGDVIYYTDAYNSKALPREDQVVVMKKCIADMQAVKDDLPIRQSSSNMIGVRPTRASAVALLMHLNMWAAAWDTQSKEGYYTAVLSLAEEMATYQDYSLLTISTENTKRIFKGRSAENLFGLLQDFNYGETFSDYANYSFFFSHYPYRGKEDKTKSFLTYDKKYIDKLFPESNADLRRSTWFENMSTESSAFQFKKFINTYSKGSGTNITMYSDDSAIIFRLPDALLLAAEAAAELNNEATAHRYLNQVRQAAGAPDILSTGLALKNDIFAERCRELIGEGHYYFDLVRTKRVIDTEFAKTVMSVGDFNRGAWTWPLIITAEERGANPNLTSNTFWN